MDNNKNDKPLEIPENEPSREIKPVSSEDAKHKRKMKIAKTAYAFAVLLAIGGALFAKIATEKTLDNLQVPIETDYVTLPPSTVNVPDEPDFEVRQNKTDVPDTRTQTNLFTEATTEETTEKQYATPYRDYFTLPLGTDILKEYKPLTPSYNSTTDDWRTHAAVDFKGAEGAQIKAISPGTVKNIFDDALLGTVMEIDHGNNVLARYCGLNKDTIELTVGKAVKSGELIGYLGTIPFEKAEEPHLHFEIIYNGEKVDPLELMGK